MVSLNCPSLQLLSKTQTVVFPISNCRNSRTSDDIDMKLGPVTNLDKGNKTTSKKIDDDVISENYDVIVIFQFTTNLEQWGSQILNA